MSEISKMLIWRRIFIPSRDASDGISQKFSVLPTQGNIRTTDLREEACIYLRCVSWHFIFISTKNSGRFVGNFFVSTHLTNLCKTLTCSQESNYLEQHFASILFSLAMNGYCVDTKIQIIPCYWIISDLNYSGIQPQNLWVFEKLILNIVLCSI